MHNSPLKLNLSGIEKVAPDSGAAGPQPDASHYTRKFRPHKVDYSIITRFAYQIRCRKNSHPFHASYLHTINIIVFFL